MRRTDRRPAVILLAAAAALLLAGCFPIPPVDERDPAPRDRGSVSDDRVVECDGAVTAVRDSDLEVRVIGTCPRVEIEGNDLDIDLDGASVDEVTLRGDRNEIDAADIGSLSVAGQDNDIDAASIGSLVITGDRNDIDARGVVGAIRIDGNDNEIEAGQLGDIADNGTRNDVRTG